MSDIEADDELGTSTVREVFAVALVIVGAIASVALAVWAAATVWGEIGG